jgi:hypothetical protein
VSPLLWEALEPETSNGLNDRSTFSGLSVKALTAAADKIQRDGHTDSPC